MEKRGLKVVRVEDPAKLQAYRAAAEEFAERVRGDRLPPEILRLAQEARAAYRRQHAASPAAAGGGGARP